MNLKPLQKYKPGCATIVPWGKIEQRYFDLINSGWRLESMLVLVKFIMESSLADKLFAYTSMDKLVVTIYNPAEYNREALHIQFNSYSKCWHFEYRPKPFEPAEHERYYPEEDGINKFCQYIKWLKW